MATKDYILGNNLPKGSKAWNEKDESVQYQKGTQQWTESASTEDNKDSEQIATPEKSESDQPQTQEKKNLTYAEMFEKLNPKPDPERLKEDAKRARTRNVIAALGDGISALANLYYTTKGAPNMLDGKNTLSEKTQARYDKLIQDYKDNLEKYRQGRLKAEQLDKEWDYRAERDKVGDEQWNKSYQLGLDKFEYQKGRDKVGDDRYAAEQEHIAEREAKADEQWNETHKFRQEQSQQTQDNWQKTFDEGVRRFNESAELKKLIAELNAKNKNSKTNSSKDKDVEYVTFTSKDKGSYKIDKDTWDDISERLYRYFVDDKVNDAEIGVGFGALLKGKNKKYINDFLQNHWHESASVTELIKNLSEEQSASDDYNHEYDEEDFSQYEVTSDDDFSQYEVK